MRSLEVKRIGAGSCFRFGFVVGILGGLLTSIVLLLTGASLRSIGIEIGTIAPASGTLHVGAAIAGVIIACLAYGLMGGAVGALGAFIYNLFAAMVGGIEIKVSD